MLSNKLFKHKQCTQETAILMRQFSAMLAAGVPLTRCFDILEKSSSSSTLRAALYKIKQKIIAGHSMAHSLSIAPTWFDHFSCQLIQLGEQTGRIDVILASLADYHDKKAALQRKLKQIIFYPCVLGITSMILTVSMMLFVIPSFANLFHDADITLPLITRAIFATSHFFNQYLLLISFCILLFACLIFYYYTRGTLSLLMNRLLHYLPPLYRCLNTLALLRFTRNLGIALAAGIPILSALQHTANICSDKPLAQAIQLARAKVSAGISLHQALSVHEHFPALIQQMVKVGEESGSLDTLLAQTANLLETQLESELTLLVQLLEPLIMLVQGVLIGGLVIGIYLPIFNLGSAL